MGLIIRRRIPVDKTTHVNVSRTGASISKRVGRVTVNSRGRISFRIARGISFRSWWR